MPMKPVVSEKLRATIIFTVLATTLSIVYCEQRKLRGSRAILRIADVLHEVGKKGK